MLFSGDPHLDAEKEKIGKRKREKGTSAEIDSRMAMPILFSAFRNLTA
jgi:hypothetical protein